MRYIYTTETNVLRFVWDHSVFAQYSYYCELFCSGPVLRLHDCHCHRWVRYNDATKITVWCMSLLLLYIDLQRFCFFSTLFKLTNGAMVKWWMVKWCNGEIKIRIGCWFSHKYRICSLVLFPNTKVLQQTKQSITFNPWSLSKSKATKFMLSNHRSPKYRDLSGVRQSLYGR